jgi:DNA-binding NarL/FixJ family response regulator
MSAALGSVTGRSTAVTWRAWIREAEGDPTGAAAYAEEALDVHAGAGSMGMLLPIPSAILARCALVTDGPTAALHALDRLPAAARDPRYLTAPIWWLARAAVALEAGDPEDALAHLGEVEAWQRAWPAPRGGWTLWEPLAVEALVALGEQDRALSLAPVGIQRASAWGADRPLARALRAAASTLPMPDRLPMLEEALELTDRGACGLDGAVYRIDAAQAHLARGDAAAAVAALQQALEMADRRGASYLANHASALLTEQGHRPERPSRTAGLGALTRAERRIVDLAATARTNREIAEALFITEKTVESHLTSAYRKLHISGRSELAAALGDAGAPRG